MLFTGLGSVLRPRNPLGLRQPLGEPNRMIKRDGA